jgi:hypothetical protein
MVHGSTLRLGANVSIDREATVISQPVHEYSTPFDDRSSPLSGYTHLGTDYGSRGPGADHMSWRQSGDSGYVSLDLTGAGWAGMWHSLSGLAGERDLHLDLAKCYPLLRDEYQPRCVGMTIRVRGDGYLKLELKSPDQRVLWWATRELCSDDWRDLEFSWSPDDLRRVKFLEWAADPGARLDVDSVRLLIEMPEVPFEQKVFLESYAKLARLYSPKYGTVREQAQQPAGECDSLPASGLFCMATCAAFSMGAVKRVVAEQILQKLNGTVSGVPKGRGLLPYYVRKYGGRYRVHHGTSYSLLGTSIYYHSMLLAAQMLWDAKTLAGLAKAVRQIEFDDLRDADGYLVEGLSDDGQTLTNASFRHWGGEAALVMLLECIATGSVAAVNLEGLGAVRDGVGCSAEIQSLFYSDFSSSTPDVVTGVDWLKARRSLLAEQKSYFPERWSKSRAAQMGFYGLSAGAGPGGVGHITNGTKSPGKIDLIHPHYVLMSGAVDPQPGAVYEVLKAMESAGLMPPWGLVENFTKELEYLPTMYSLSAAFECIGAYHLWAKSTGKPDHVYRAAEYCPFLWEAARAFHPSTSRW